MKPDSTKKQLLNMQQPMLKAKTSKKTTKTPTAEVEYMRNKLAEALKIEHHEESCLMCNGITTKNKLTSNIRAMRATDLKWHLNSLFNSKGQRLNRELLDGMLNQYQEIENSLRRNNKISKQATPTVITIGVSA